MGLTDQESARVAFGDFVRAEIAALTRSAFLLTGDRHHAEDLVQVSLARVAVGWERIDDPAAYARRVPLLVLAVPVVAVLRRRRAYVTGARDGWSRTGRSSAGPR